jgi:hypothetical protein
MSMAISIAIKIAISISIKKAIPINNVLGLRERW